MGDVLVRRASLADGKVSKLAVELHGLGERVIDRDTVLSWMRDGHSFVPVLGGKRQPALQLVEVGEGEHVIRTDNEATDGDLLPELPSV
jgi:hypothetical protein